MSTQINLENLPNMLMLPLATAVGAWGGFGEPPQKVKEFMDENEWSKYLFLAILIWQGGGGQNVEKTMMAVVAFMLISSMLE